MCWTPNFFKTLIVSRVDSISFLTTRSLSMRDSCFNVSGVRPIIPTFLPLHLLDDEGLNFPF